MRVSADRLNVVSSSKVTPSEEFAPVASVSFLNIGSATCNAVAAALPRVTVALPCRVATWPTELSAGAAAGACVAALRCGGWPARA